MKEAKQKNCIIYCRVSSAKQAQQGESLDEQERICTGLAERNNLNNLKVFKEQFSGRKNDRPVIDSIFSYIKSSPKKVDYLIFRAIDRFSRNGTKGYETLQDKLKSQGVQLIDSTGIIQPTKNTLEHLDVEYDWSITRPSEITELVMAQQGKNEVNQILTRMIGQEINLTREGYKVRQSDDGYVNEKVFVEGKKKVIQIPDPIRAPFLIKMFNMRASGSFTDQQIVDKINAMGYRSRIQNKWSKSKEKIIGEKGGLLLTTKKLQKIIARPIYCGVNNEKWLNGKPIKTKYKGLVSIALFNKANKGRLFIEEQKNGDIVIHKDYNPHQLKRMKNNPLFPFKELIVCPHCQKPFLGSSTKGKSGKYFPVYHCARNHKYYGVSKKDLEEKLTKYVSTLKNKDAGFMPALKFVVMAKYKQKEKELGKFSADVGITIQELESEKKQKIEAYTSTANEIIRAELEIQVNELQQQIKKVQQEDTGIKIKENDINAFGTYVEKLMEHPEKMLIEEENLTILHALHGLVFEGVPTYTEIINGTPKLSLPYMLSREFKDVKSLLVTSRRIELRLAD